MRKAAATDFADFLLTITAVFIAIIALVVSLALTAANLLLPPQRYAAYRQVEKSLLSREMPLVPYETSVLPEFFSARIGCKVFQPVVQQVDIGALCIKSS